MLIRSRSARFAALALAVTTPLVAANALPAFAAGESASATLTSPESGSDSTFTWNYSFGGGEHALSNIAIRFCSADILADVESAGPAATIYLDGDTGGGHDGFGPGIKFGVTEPIGTLTVTFKNSHEIYDSGMEIQSHSGDGQTGDAITTTKGPGPCPSDPTDDGDGDGDGDGNNDDDVVIDNNTGGGNNGGGNNGGGNNGGDNNTGVGNNGGENNTDGGNTNSSDPAKSSVPSTDVLGVTVEEANASAPAPALSPAASPALLGETLAAGGELPRTGAANVSFLMTLALSLLAAGLTLRAAFGRRTRSAFFPG